MEPIFAINVLFRGLTLRRNCLVFFLHRVSYNSSLSPILRLTLLCLRLQFGQFCGTICYNLSWISRVKKILNRKRELVREYTERDIKDGSSSLKHGCVYGINPDQLQYVLSNFSQAFDIKQNRILMTRTLGNNHY